jgi:uncharacterized protein with PQ loop repeat
MNIAMFVSPLQKIQEVYKTKDNSYIPIQISIVLTINCLIWTSFGMLRNFNLYIIIPNTIGVIFSLFQIYLWFKFNNSENIKSKDDNSLGNKRLPEKENIEDYKTINID